MAPTLTEGCVSAFCSFCSSLQESQPQLIALVSLGSEGGNSCFGVSVSQEPHPQAIPLILSVGFVSDAEAGGVPRRMAPFFPGVSEVILLIFPDSGCPIYDFSDHII
jgi:hypothetical protein